MTELLQGVVEGRIDICGRVRVGFICWPVEQIDSAGRAC